MKGIILEEVQFLLQGNSRISLIVGRLEYSFVKHKSIILIKSEE